MVAGYEYAHYRNSTFRRIYYEDFEDLIDYNTNLKFSKFNAFGQVSKSFLDQKLSLSLGVRSDINTYSSVMSNPVNQLSPRFSASYALTDIININFSTGRYYQLPPYTALGYSNSSSVFINRQNNLKYMAVDHLVAGLELLPSENIQVTLEGFL